jgi:hypothetical protein
MAQKTRSQLQTQSDNTFLDNSTGQIVPVNHREWNNDTIDSVATQLDSNDFQGINTFSQQINSLVGIDGNALYSENADVRLDSGGVFCGGDSSMEVTFIRHLQNAFDDTVIDAPSSGRLLDLTNANANFIYIEGDGEFNAFSGLIGRIYYAMHTGTVDYKGLDKVPEYDFRIFPNDTLIFVFTSESTIRVLGIRRFSGGYQKNGQNFFTINSIEDLITIKSDRLLDVGATYRVLNAYLMPPASGILWDIYLTAIDKDVFAQVCYLRSNTFNDGTFQKAHFNGSFDSGAIRITEEIDTSCPFSYALASTSNTTVDQWINYGTKIYVAEGTAGTGIGFQGYIHLNNGGFIQRNNILDTLDRDNPFGRILTIKDQSNNLVDKFIKHSSATIGGSLNFGANFFDTLTPTIAELNTLMSSLGYGATITYYSVSFQIVNNGCVVNFNATATAKFNEGTSGREARILLPQPFNADGTLLLQYGYGTCRNITDSNHEDIGLIATRKNDKYFEVSAKWNTIVGTNKSLIFNGAYVYPTVFHVPV